MPSIDSRALGALVTPLRHAVGAESFARIASSALAPLFRSSRAVFVERPRRASVAAPLSPEEVHFVGWPHWCKTHYCRHLRQRDPIRRWVECDEISREGGAVRLSDLVPVRKMVHADYYQSMLRPSGAAYVLALAIGGDAEPSGVLSLVRNGDAGDFSEDDRSLAQTLAPLLAVAYALAAERSLRDADPPRLARALDGEIFFSFDADGRLHAMTGAAVAIERAWAGSRLSAAALQALNASREVPTRAAIEVRTYALELPIVGPCEVRWTHDTNGRRAGLLVTPLQTQNATRSMPAFADLTARERQVLDLVVRGHANKEIGRILGTSPWTVKNQMRAVLAKTGARSRTELCALAGAAA
jgi:DNA-binding CsgD family transcriptional regulator